MLRVGRLLRSSPPVHATLSRWTRHLASAVAALPSTRDQSAIASSSSSSSKVLWEDVLQATRQAFAMKETDTIYSIVHCLVSKGYYPPQSEIWPQLARWLLTFADVECTSVLCFPGESEAAWRAATSTGARSFPPNPSTSLEDDFTRVEGGGMGREPGKGAPSMDSGAATSPYFIFPSREMLLLTGGVVPLSARVSCADGKLLHCFLELFHRYVREEILPPTALQRDPPHMEAAKLYALFENMNHALLGVLRANINTIQIRFVVKAFVEYVALLWEVDRLLEGQRDLQSAQDESTETTLPASLLLTFVRSLTQKEVNPATSALGSRLALCGVAFALNRMILAGGKTADDASGEVGFDFNTLLSFPGYLLSEVALPLRSLQFEMVGVVVRGLPRYYERSVWNLEEKGSTRLKWPPLASLLEKVFDFVDVSLQHNANQNNPMNLSEEGEQQLRQEVLLCWLRCLRVEATSPTVFLRDSMSIVERCTPSMALEAELIAGKVALFDYFELLEEGKKTIYDDILTSLRHLLELRPRPNASSGAGASGEVFFYDEGRGSEGEVEEQTSAEGLLVRPSTVSLKGDTQELIQNSHQLVIKALCDSHEMQCVNDAYNIVIAHKYQGLIVTKEIIRPLIEALSRHGDCRVFNLVDLCVLYSNNQIDMPIIAGLFRTCAVAGDHHRARTLLQLLQDIVPGFLVKATPDIIEVLKELKVLPPEPYHLFVSEEEKLEKSALGYFADVSPREIPNLTPINK
ncbi:unnamed protein product [Phytomonas sp. EM1]|nr:unnamed protein product [Phytomonas sp. EM1]|eukprot:CCW61068.1 unnamed protein product [Phytomonas sp. isolate EM1]